MFETINYSEIHGFPKIFLDLINRNKFIESRFPSNNGLMINESLISNKADNYLFREKLPAVIKDTMEGIDFSESQIINFSKLSKSNTVAVVTGQQVGFLGGPIYTYLKICSAIIYAEKLSSIYPQFNFIPIFWVEDNDHDNFEASHISVLNKNNDIIDINCDPDGIKEDRTIVARKTFNDDITEIINSLEELLPYTEFKANILSDLKEFYSPNKLWTKSFIELINSFLNQKGILFVSATKIREHGFFQDLVLQEIDNIGETRRLVEQANEVLLSNNYQIQAKVNKVNLFIQDDSNRLKIYDLHNNKFKIGERKVTLEELVYLSKTQPTQFSPNVILRPIFQDYALPTIAYISGPSEIGYIAQIKEAYEFFKVQMPAIIPRHSATFVNNNVSKFLEKNNLNTEYLLKDFSIIEKDLSYKFMDKNIDELFSKSDSDIKSMYENIIKLSSKIDSTLERSAMSAMQKILNEHENLYKKIISANKKNYQIEFNRYSKASNYVFPKNTPQERIYSTINIINEIGINNFNNIIFKVFDNVSSKHFVISM